MVDDYYSTLEKKPSIKDSNKMVSVYTIKSINKLLRCAFNMSRKWELIKGNPFEDATLLYHKNIEREVLTPEEIMTVLNV